MSVLASIDLAWVLAGVAFIPIATACFAVAQGGVPEHRKPTGRVVLRWECGHCGESNLWRAVWCWRCSTRKGKA